MVIRFHLGSGNLPNLSPMTDNISLMKIKRLRIICDDGLFCRFVLNIFLVLWFTKSLDIKVTR